MSIEGSYVTDNPRIFEDVTGDSIVRSYLWETPDMRKIFLHLTLSLGQSETFGSYLKAHTNLDSSEVKGQGQHIWLFLKKQLKELANNGIRDIPPTQVLHEVIPNEYSLKIIEKDGDYIKKGKSFYRLYKPSTEQ